MINFLLNEVYIKFTGPFFINPNGADGGEIDAHDVSNILQGLDNKYTYKYLGVSILTEEDFKNVFNSFRLEEIEKELLQRVAYHQALTFDLDWGTDYIDTYDSTLIESVTKLNISDYLNDRNLMDLVLYLTLLNEIVVAK